MMGEERFIQDAILRAVQHRLKQIIEEEASAAAENVRRRIWAEADNLALSILAEYHIERHGSVVTITVKKEIGT